MTINKINSLIQELEAKLLHAEGIINRFLIVQEIKALTEQLEAQSEYYYL